MAKNAKLIQKIQYTFSDDSDDDGEGDNPFKHIIRPKNTPSASTSTSIGSAYTTQHSFVKPNRPVEKKAKSKAAGASNKQIEKKAESEVFANLQLPTSKLSFLDVTSTSSEYSENEEDEVQLNPENKKGRGQPTKSQPRSRDLREEVPRQKLENDTKKGRGRPREGQSGSKGQEKAESNVVNLQQSTSKRMLVDTIKSNSEVSENDEVPRQPETNNHKKGRGRPRKSRSRSKELNEEKEVARKLKKERGRGRPRESRSRSKDKEQAESKVVANLQQPSSKRTFVDTTKSSSDESENGEVSEVPRKPETESKKGRGRPRKRRSRSKDLNEEEEVVPPKLENKTSKLRARPRKTRSRSKDVKDLKKAESKVFGNLQLLASKGALVDTKNGSSEHSENEEEQRRPEIKRGRGRPRQNPVFGNLQKLASSPKQEFADNIHRYGEDEEISRKPENKTKRGRGRPKNRRTPSKDQVSSQENNSEGETQISVPTDVLHAKKKRPVKSGLPDTEESDSEYELPRRKSEHKIVKSGPIEQVGKKARRIDESEDQDDEPNATHKSLTIQKPLKAGSASSESQSEIEPESPKKKMSSKKLKKVKREKVVKPDVAVADCKSSDSESEDDYLPPKGQQTTKKAKLDKSASNSTSMKKKGEKISVSAASPKNRPEESETSKSEFELPKKKIKHKIFTSADEKVPKKARRLGENKYDEPEPKATTSKALKIQKSLKADSVSSGSESEIEPESPKTKKSSKKVKRKKGVKPIMADFKSSDSETEDDLSLRSPQTTKKAKLDKSSSNSTSMKKGGKVSQTDKDSLPLSPSKKPNLSEEESELSTLSKTEDDDELDEINVKKQTFAPISTSTPGPLSKKHPKILMLESELWSGSNKTVNINFPPQPPPSVMIASRKSPVKFPVLRMEKLVEENISRAPAPKIRQVEIATQTLESRVAEEPVEPMVVDLMVNDAEVKTPKIAVEEQGTQTMQIEQQHQYTETDIFDQLDRIDKGTETLGPDLTHASCSTEIVDLRNSSAQTKIPQQTTSTTTDDWPEVTHAIMQTDDSVEHVSSTAGGNDEEEGQNQHHVEGEEAEPMNEEDFKIIVHVDPHMEEYMKLNNTTHQVDRLSFRNGEADKKLTKLCIPENGQWEETFANVFVCAFKVGNHTHGTIRIGPDTVRPFEKVPRVTTFLCHRGSIIFKSNRSSIVNNCRFSVPTTLKEGHSVVIPPTVSYSFENRTAEEALLHYSYYDN